MSTTSNVLALPTKFRRVGTSSTYNPASGNDYSNYSNCYIAKIGNISARSVAQADVVRKRIPYVLVRTDGWQDGSPTCRRSGSGLDDMRAVLSADVTRRISLRIRPGTNEKFAASISRARVRSANGRAVFADRVRNRTR